MDDKAMTPKSVAESLNGSEYPLRVTAEQRSAWKAAGIVVVYGASDDLMEFDGAINDEWGCYGGGDIQIDERGIIGDFEALCDDRNEGGLKRYFASKEAARTITANWDSGGYSWTYSTDIPHETFEIIEDGEKYCRGVVFSLGDLT